MTKDKPRYVKWTPAKLKRFKRAYEKAEGDIFVFDKHEYLKSYAKYLIPYLEKRFEHHGMP